MKANNTRTHALESLAERLAADLGDASAVSQGRIEARQQRRCEALIALVHGRADLDSSTDIAAPKLRVQHSNRNLGYMAAQVNLKGEWWEVNGEAVCA